MRKKYCSGKGLGHCQFSWADSTTEVEKKNNNIIYPAASHSIALELSLAVPAEARLLLPPAPLVASLRALHWMTNRLWEHRGWTLQLIGKLSIPRQLKNRSCTARLQPLTVLRDTDCTSESFQVPSLPWPSGAMRDDGDSRPAERALDMHSWLRTLRSTSQPFPWQLALMDFRAVGN